MSQDPFLRSVGTIIDSLNAALFDNRLPRAQKLILTWHDNVNEGQAWIDVEHKILSLHRSCRELDRLALVKLLVHEACHWMTRGEVDHHGPRWQACMRRCGINPWDGATIWKSPFWFWREQRTEWLAVR